MFNRNRTPLIAAASAGLLYAVLYLTCFPVQRQFAKYAQAAAQSLAGTLPAERLLDFSPFYFYLHLAPQMAGATGGALFVWVQIGAMAATAGLLTLLLLRFFSWRLALAGVIAFILSRSAMVYACVLEPEPFLLLFVVAFLYFSLLEGVRERLLAGLALALALTVRPTILPLLVAIPLYCRLNEGRQRWMKSSALLILPALGVLLLLGIRNGTVSGSYSPVVMNPGFVFFEGNNPLSQGNSAVYPPLVGELRTELGDQPDNPHLTYRLLASREAGRQLATAEANGFWRAKAWNFIVDYPGRFLRLLATKGYFILHDYRRHDLATAYLYDEALQQRWIPSLPLVILTVPALCGLVVMRRDWRRLLLVYTFFAGQVATMLLMYVSDRQRLALIPVLVFFAVAAVAYGAGLPAKRRLALAGVGLVLAVLLFLPNSLMRDNQHLWRGYEASDQAWMQALALREKGQRREAARVAARGYAAAPWLTDYSRPAYLDFTPGGIVARALDEWAADPRDRSQIFDRAQLLLAARRFDEAEVLLEELQAEGVQFERSYLQSSQPLYYLGLISVRRGNRPLAIRRFTEGLEAAPGDPFILAQLAALTGKEVYRSAIARYFDEVEAEVLVGMAQLELHEAAAAVASLKSAGRHLPELWRIKVYLAVALAEAGEAEQAAELGWEALVGRGDPVLLEEGVVPIFAGAVARRPADVILRYRYGVVLAQYGRLREGLRELQRAAAANGGALPEIRQAVADVQAMLAQEG